MVKKTSNDQFIPAWLILGAFAVLLIFWMFLYGSGIFSGRSTVERVPDTYLVEEIEESG